MLLSRALNTALRRLGATMSPQDVANCAYGLSLMCFDIEDPSDVSFRGTHETMLSIINRAGRGLGLSQQQMQQQSLQQQPRDTKVAGHFREAIAGQSKSAVADTIEADSTVVMAFDEYSPNNHNKASVGTDDEEEEVVVVAELEQLRIFAHYLQTMQFVTDTRRIPQALLLPPSPSSSAPLASTSLWMNCDWPWSLADALRRGLDHDSRTMLTAASSGTTSSRLQERVVTGLEEALLAVSEQSSEWYSSINKDSSGGSSGSVGRVLGRRAVEGSLSEFTVALEVSSFGGVLPVDAAVSRRGRVIALLEVDGPHHYLPDGRLRRQDQLKEALYRRRHPGSVFHRIRWDDEMQLGSDVLARELVEVLLESAARSDDVLGNGLRSVQKAMGDFFSWSMRNSKDLAD